MKKLDIPAPLAARFDTLPLKLSVLQVAELFHEKTPTVRQQIRRGTFPITVHQIEGAEQYILLADLIRFCSDGIPQIQAPLVKREARNPFGCKGKLGRGRPKKSVSIARENAAKPGEALC